MPGLTVPDKLADVDGLIAELLGRNLAPPKSQRDRPGRDDLEPDIVDARGSSASSIHLMARPCLRGSAARSSALASSERRSIVRCCGSPRDRLGN